MVLQWLMSGLLVLLSGLGVLHSAVSLQSYLLLGAGLALAASGTILMVKDASLEGAA